jgi:D-alanyl-lipoteichoic acid acyltransferase DltB (MBOAT superfamily)
MELDGVNFLAFLGCVAGLQAILPSRGRVVLLLGASLVFYALFSLPCLILLLGLCVVNYAAARLLGADSPAGRRTLVFAITVLLDLAVLIGFKYLPSLAAWWPAHGGGPGPAGGVLRILVPLGLSYFTFQMVACVTDAYRGTWQPEGGFREFALFGLFFPQITSGPIPRAGSLLPQLRAGGAPTASDRLAGLRLIALGFFKKFVIASRLSEYVTDIFNQPPAGNCVPSLLAAAFNVMQLYADFSGYVDIAIGSARFLGIRLDPNFDHPFSATSVIDFWRRWHMTLSFWLRDYLFMPLVIRLRDWGKLGMAAVTIFTFAICGIWHGPTMTFLLFGLSQGIAMAIELLTKSWRTRKLRPLPAWLVDRLGNAWVLVFFTLSQIMFRSANLPQALAVYGHLFHLRLAGGLGGLLGAQPFNFALDALAIAAWVGVDYLYDRTTDRTTPWFVALCAALVLLLGCVGSANFIYAAF